MKIGFNVRRSTKKECWTQLPCDLHNLSYDFPSDYYDIYIDDEEYIDL